MITTLVSQTGQVAKAIGVTKEELQSALDVSTWDGLMLVFEKLAGKGGLAAIAPLMGDLGSDGSRLNQVISALTSDTSRLTRELNIANDAFAKGTSVVDEYEKKNNNLAGTIEKIGKNIKYWFLGSGIIDWMLKVAKMIEQITRGSESLLEQFEKQKRTTNNLTTSLSPLLDQIDKLKDSQSADEQKRLSEIMQQVGQSIPGAVTWMDRYGKILGINTERARAFIEEQKNAMQVLNKGAIEETEKKLYELQKQEVVLEEIVNEINQKGTFTSSQTIQTSTFGTSQTISFEEDSQEKIKEKQDRLISIQQEIQKTKSLLRTLTGETLEDMQQVEEETTKATVAIAETDKEQKERIKKEQAAIDLWLQQKKNALSEARLAEQDANSESYISQEEYNRAVEGLEMEAMRKRLAILGLEPNEVAKIEGQILDIRQKIIDETIKAQQKAKEEVDKLLLDADPIKKENIEYEERLKKIDVFGKQREELTKEQLSALELLEKQHTDNLIEIEIRLQKRREKLAEEKFQKEYKEELEAKKTSLQDKEDVTDIRSKLGFDTETETYKRQQETSKKKIELMYYELKKRQEIGATEIDILNDIENERSKMTDRAVNEFVRVTNVAEQYGTQIGDAFGQMFTSVEDGWKALGDVAIDIIFDLVEKHITAKLVELAATGVSAIGKASAESFATPDSVLTFGASGAARMAIMTGLISGVIATAKVGLKSLLNKKKEGATTTSGSTGQRVVKTSGFRVGGFTGEGPTYEVAGVVHRGEYIVPKWQMYDPISFNMVRALEAIRQTRSHENILSVHRNGYAEGGLVQTPMQTISMQPNDPQMVALMQDMYALLSSLRRDGVKTVFSVSRLEQTQARLNASRLRGSLKK